VDFSTNFSTDIHMASVHQRPKSPYWHASYLGPDGRWILRSTKQENRQSALAVALEYERAAKLARRGELIEAQAREVLKDIMKRADIGETLQGVSIKSHFDGWLETKRTRKSKSTGERYGVAVDDFLKTLGKRATRPLTSLTVADVQRFLDHRTAKKLSPATLILDVKIIGGALNAARRQGLIPTNPAEAVDLPEAKGMERGTFTPAEVKMLVDTAKGEWKLLIILAYFTGARLSDCCRMQWDDIGDVDQQSALLLHLATYAPLACVAHSGNKSLHGWFYVFLDPEEKVQRFMEYALSLGADPATWTPCQLVRIPDGLRDNGNRQTVFFFNPNYQNRI